jgi:hypothetical protein
MAAATRCPVAQVRHQRMLSLFMRGVRLCDIEVPIR